MEKHRKAVGKRLEYEDAERLKNGEAIEKHREAVEKRVENGETTGKRMSCIDDATN